MNVIETIGKELEGKSLSELEKIRYIYIRSAQLFHFDTRWRYSLIFKDGITDEIMHKDINLEDVKDFNTVCHKFVPCVQKELIERLTNVKAGHLYNGSHSVLAIYNLSGENWILDATKSDLSRLKLDLLPRGMHGSITNDPKMFINMDKKLGFNYKEESYYTSLVSSPNKREEFENISKLLSSLENVNGNFSDSNLFFNVCTAYGYCKNSVFVDRSYDFHKVIRVNRCSYDEEELFYDMSMNNGKYSLSEITEEEYNTLTKRLEHHKLDNNDAYFG